MRFVLFLTLLLQALPSAAFAACGLIFPSDDIVIAGESPALVLQVGTFDPLDRPSRETGKPQRFGVLHLSEQTDLLATLKPVQKQAPTAWTATFAVKRPGDYTFYTQHQPLWVTADEQFIVHHAKLCVNALGLEEGWDEPVGLEAEIIPLSRPYGLWVGNLFSGQLLLNGEPAPYGMIEIVWFGEAPDNAPLVAPPTPAYRIQKVRTDANGVFHYAMPRAGWWGFAAILEADWTIKQAGEEKPVSLVTSYWVKARELK